MDTLYDPIRCKQVANTPEERIRQALIAEMLGPLAFPKSLIAVEKKLSQLCCERAGRRIDIAAFMKKGERLEPLLLVECKANISDEERVFEQAFGYNASLAAPFWCLAHEGGVRTFWTQAGEIRSVLFLPSYPELLSRVI